MMFLDPAPGSGLHDIWHFFNADGSRAEMCGNGSRCAARLAHLIGLAPAHHVFGTDAGPIEASVDEETGLVTVQLTPPVDLRLNETLEVEGQTITLHSVNTGVPHAVTFVDDLEAVDVWKFGRAVRFHHAFEPAGTNMNFVAVEKPGKLSLRTYERGVEEKPTHAEPGRGPAVGPGELSDRDETVVTTTGGEELGHQEDGKTSFAARRVVYRVIFLEASGYKKDASGGGAGRAAGPAPAAGSRTTGGGSNALQGVNIWPW